MIEHTHTHTERDLAMPPWAGPGSVQSLPRLICIDNAYLCNYAWKGQGQRGRGGGGVAWGWGGFLSCRETFAATRRHLPLIMLTALTSRRNVSEGRGSLASSLGDHQQCQSSLSIDKRLIALPPLMIMPDDDSGTMIMCPSNGQFVFGGRRLSDWPPKQQLNMQNVERELVG